ncbi:MAG: helix-turn-helix domain-containing protein [Desulfatitalea sp.]|nr:DUF4115 domain-containing protein [Desulfatitalea sp.]NNK02718.1 helix-turn-helix domain-containing protein [Desulfatitalea sp.]
MNPSEPMTDFGRFLQTHRRARQMALEAVSQETKIRVTVLRQIENEDLENLPQTIYTKGFIRAFAKTVGADVHEALNRYEAGSAAYLAPMQSEPQEKKRSVGVRPWFGVVCAILVALMLGMVLLFQRPKQPEAPQATMETAPKVTERAIAPEPTPSRPPPQGAETVPEVTAEPLTTDTPPASEASDQTPKQTLPPTAPDDLPDVTAPDASEAETRMHPDSFAEDTATPGFSTPAAPTDPAGAPKEMVLRINAMAITWIKINLDDQPPTEVTLQPGEQAVYKAEHGFDMLIGNAAGVQLTLDDQPVQVRGGSGKVVRLRLP